MQDKKDTIGRIYEKYNKKIYDFLYKFNHDPELSADLMQESFLSFFDHYQSANLDDKQSLMILYRIARNNSINHSNKLSTKKENVVYIDNFQSGQSSFEKQEELKDMEQKLHECLEYLPEDQKTALILKNLNDMTLDEISKIMEVSISTVSRLVVKATAKLIELANTKGIIP